MSRSPIVNSFRITPSEGVTGEVYFAAVKLIRAAKCLEQEIHP